MEKIKFEFEHYDTQEEVREKIQECEGDTPNKSPIRHSTTA